MGGLIIPTVRAISHQATSVVAIVDHLGWSKCYRFCVSLGSESNRLSLTVRLRKYQVFFTVQFVELQIGEVMEMMEKDRVDADIEKNGVRVVER